MCIASKFSFCSKWLLQTCPPINASQSWQTLDWLQFSILCFSGLQTEPSRQLHKPLKQAQKGQNAENSWRYLPAPRWKGGNCYRIRSSFLRRIFHMKSPRRGEQVILVSRAKAHELNPGGGTELLTFDRPMNYFKFWDFSAEYPPCRSRYSAGFPNPPKSDGGGGSCSRGG